MGLILIGAAWLHICTYCAVPIAAWFVGRPKDGPAPGVDRSTRDVLAAWGLGAAIAVASALGRNLPRFVGYTQETELYGFSVMVDTMFDVPSFVALGLTAGLCQVKRYRRRYLFNAGLLGASISLCLQPAWPWMIVSCLDGYGIKWTS